MTQPATQPRLSVVIPTLGRPILIQTLEALIKTEGFEQLDIIVVGTLREPAISERVRLLVEQYPPIRHIDVSFAQGDSSEKKNTGWRAARAEIVAFLDDDVVVAPDWPLRMREAFDNSAVALVSGPGLIPPDSGRFARLAGLALASPAAGYVAWRYRNGDDALIPIKWSQIIGCNMAYRRTVLESIGGFDTKFWPGEEMIAAYRAQRAGHALRFYSPAYCYHYPRQSPYHFWKQMFGYGATRIRLIRGGVELEPSTLIPAAWVAAMAGSLFGVLFHTGFFYLFIVIIASYTAVASAVALLMVRETRRIDDLLLLFVIPIMHLSYGIAGWYEFLCPDRDLGINAAPTKC